MKVAAQWDRGRDNNFMTIEDVDWVWSGLDEGETSPRHSSHQTSKPGQRNPSLNSEKNTERVDPGESPPPGQLSQCLWRSANAPV